MHFGVSRGLRAAREEGRAARKSLVDTYSTAILLKLVASGQLRMDELITHRFPLNQIIEAYDVFTRAANTGALRIVLTRS
jgi:alcohol dehydrogenase